jgi:hypothetical protein
MYVVRVELHIFTFVNILAGSLWSGRLADILGLLLTGLPQLASINLRCEPQRAQCLVVGRGSGCQIHEHQSFSL